jgi:hypothetical protein
VHLAAGELAWDLREVRAPEVTVGDQNTVEDALVTARGDHPPSGRTHRPGPDRFRRHRGDPRVECDQVIVTVVARVGLDIGADLVPPGKVRVVLRHREALERGHVPRGDQVQGLVVGMPVPADPAGLLKALGVVARLAELLEGGDARRASPDDAVAR